MRGIPQTDAAVRRGEWPKVMRPSISGKHLGIVGLGAVGMEIARMAKEKNISKVVFDRNGYLYHGRVKAVADGAREGGLEF